MKLKKLSLTLARYGMSALFVAGCSVDTVDSRDVQPDAVYQDYDVSYSEADRATKFNATFRVGGSTGTTIALSEPSSLRVNGQPVSSSNFFGTRYSTKLGTGFVADTLVHWTDQKGELFVNRLTIRPIQLQAYPGVITIGSGFAVTFWAPDIDSRDRFSARLRGPGQSSEILVSSQAEAGRTMIYFAPEALKELRVGVAHLQLERTAAIGLQQVTREGGWASTRYSTAEVQIRVEAAPGQPALVTQSTSLVQR